MEGGGGVVYQGEALARVDDGILGLPPVSEEEKTRLCLPGAAHRPQPHAHCGHPPLQVTCSGQSLVIWLPQGGSTALLIPRTHLTIR